MLAGLWRSTAAALWCFRAKALLKRMPRGIRKKHGVYGNVVLFVGQVGFARLMAAVMYCQNVCIQINSSDTGKAGAMAVKVFPSKTPQCEAKPNCRQIFRLT